MSSPTPLAQRIREFRERRKLSRADLARALGIKPPSVHDWENGATAPRLDRLPSLATALGVTVDDLLGATKS